MGELINIWRIENERGLGPYAGSSELARIFKRISYSFAPLPSSDKKLSQIFNKHGKIKAELFFGFKTLDDYKHWFYKKGHRITLEKKGFKLVQYEIDKDYVHFGSAQLTFNKSKATALQSLSCDC